MQRTSNQSGFILVEAITAVALVGICLTLIIQALLTNLKAGAQFQQKTKAIFAAENRLGEVFASQGSSGDVPSTPQELEEPYSHLTVQVRLEDADDNLKKMELIFNDSKGKPGINVATFIYRPEQTKTSNLIAP